ncbi:hypothetical protein [Geofilum rubicundum]|uniref:Uncharacterized protein n=1 Tax=Geofilum rubicundum JCM 15548 TaxID=1236989 RepID=A0A0E9M2G3_9BACT|nr:hypothetical protein [Geofilum rubicundum]GAO31571.1 hypothetical protein JCM15548_13944 [Geofilum rubicundum JCM 15548]
MGLFFFNQPDPDKSSAISHHSTPPPSEHQEEALLSEDHTSSSAASSRDDDATRTAESEATSQPDDVGNVHQATANATRITLKEEHLPSPPFTNLQGKAEPHSGEPSVPSADATTQHLAYAPDKPIFASKKVEIKKLFEDQSIEDWKENYNVSSRYFDEQEALSATSQKRKLQIGGAVSPIYSFRQTSGESSLPTAASMPGNYSEKGLMSTGGGIHVNLEMGKNWGIESGVRYARLGQEVHADIQSSRVYAMNTENEAYGTTSLKTISLENSLATSGNHKAVPIKPIATGLLQVAPIRCWWISETMKR